jgi:hypothetical protein
MSVLWRSICKPTNHTIFGSVLISEFRQTCCQSVAVNFAAPDASKLPASFIIHLGAEILKRSRARQQYCARAADRSGFRRAY